MIRLLFLSDHLGYSSGVTHGATTYFMNVLPALKTKGIDLQVCFLRGRHSAADKLEEHGITPQFLNRGKWDPRALSDLVALIKKHHINLVHAAGMKGILLGRMACRICGCKFIMHLHDTSVPGPLLCYLQRAMAGWTDRCLVISNAVGEFARDVFGVSQEQLALLYNGIDLVKVANPIPKGRKSLRREFNLPDNVPVVGIVGRLSTIKGQALFLQAMPDLLRTHPNVHLLFAGEGPARAECETLTAKFNLKNSVVFAGHRTDMPDVLSAIDLLAVPSLQEGLSYSAIEAMAAGRPVAAFGVGGLPELIIHEQTGLLAPPGDALALVEAVRRLLDDKHLYDLVSSNARSFAQKFSIANHVESLIAIYQEVLRSNAGPN